jgi:hypothetical protein
MFTMLTCKRVKLSHPICHLLPLYDFHLPLAHFFLLVVRLWLQCNMQSQRSNLSLCSRHAAPAVASVPVVKDLDAGRKRERPFKPEADEINAIRFCIHVAE